MKMHNIINKQNITNVRIMNIIKQFMKFGIVGIMNTVISLAVYYAFVFVNKNLFIVGYILGFTIGVLNAYYWNNKFVFSKKTKGNVKPLVKSFFAYCSTLLLSTAMLYAMVHILNISEMIAPIINILVTLPLNFLLNKFWAFK